MNKTGFQISCEKAQLVVTMEINKPFSMINLDNYDYITLIKCIILKGDNSTYIIDFNS